MNCDGTLDPAHLSPVCGWSYNDQAAPQGSIVFVPGSMIPQAPDVLNSPYVMKTVPAPIPTVKGITAQWLFRESTEAGATPTYIFLFTNDGNTEQMYVQLDQNMDLVLEIGPTLAQNIFSTHLNSKPGDLRKLSVVVDSVGIARVFFDDVEFPVTPDGTTSARAGFHGNSSFVLLQNPSGPPISFKLEKIFLSTGTKGTVNFCCS